MHTEQWSGLTVRITGGTDGNGGGDGPVVVLLHGFGAPGDDLVGLWRAIDAPRGTRWVFPHAPMALGGPYGNGRAWWMIDLARMERAMRLGTPRDLTDEVPEGLAPARAQLAAVLDEIPSRLSVGPERLVIGGFSQGAMLTCDLALREPSRPLAGLVQLSGTLIAQHEWVPLMPARRGLRVFQSHGREDEVLGYAYAEALRDRLADAGVQIEWVPFRGGHGIPGPVLDRLGGFLRAVLPA